LYFGDTARLPYGSKSAETVAKYAVEASHFLEKQGAGLLVIACNTATALAKDTIRRGVSVPVVGVIEPGAEQASALSKARRAVVIATEATVGSHAYLKALQSRGMEAKEKACPLLVPLVEEGWVEHAVTEQVARVYLQEAFADGFDSADVLLLGCTHYPLLKPTLRRIVPADVTIVDSAESTAHIVAQQLGSEFAAPAQSSTPHVRFFATDSAEKFQKLGARFLGQPIEEVEHADLRE
jgi:glutamate racemase